MKARSIWLIPVLLCFQALVLSQELPKYKELPNFHRVNETLYRGGQPEKGGLDKLKELGIKTIIDLRGDQDQTEGVKARAQGFEYFNFPMERIGRPDDETVKKVLQTILAKENQPVFVHCARGSDRTGTIIAIYRIEHDGWTSKQAKDEAKRFGMGPWEVQMKDYIHDYYEQHGKGVATTSQ